MLKLAGNVGVAKAYRWSMDSEQAKAEGPCLVEDAEPGADDGSTMRERYDPFAKVPALFRDFAKLPPDQDAILEFASQFGACFSSTPESLREPWTLRMWKVNSSDMAELVTLHDAIVHNDEKQLKKIISLDNSGHAEFHLGSGPLSRIPLVVRKPGQAERFESLLDAARFLRKFVIKHYMTMKVEPQLSRLADGRLALQFLTYELSEVLWLQAALAAVGDKDYEDCWQCGRAFERAPSVNRADKRFCSDSCRAKHYYQQKQKAFVLLGRGKSAQQIAEATGYDVPTVKGWFKPKKRESNESKTKRPRRR